MKIIEKESALPVLRYVDLKPTELFKMVDGGSALLMKGDFGWVNLETGAQAWTESPDTRVRKYKLDKPMEVSIDWAAKAVDV